MLALWSQAARTLGTCRCISCVSNGSTIARRGGAIGLNGSWALGAPTSTFVYTAVFAAGLAIDAKAKRNRNEQWDAVFSHLQEAISQPHILQRGDDTEKHEWEEAESIGENDFIPVEELFRNGVDWGMIYRASGMELEDGVDFHERQSDIDLEHLSESLWHLLPYDSRLPSAPVLEWPANTGRDLIRHYLPPQSLWAPENMRWKAMRKRQSWKKLAIQELSVGMLVHTLLGYTHVAQLREDVLASLSPHIYHVAQLDLEQRKILRRQILESIETMCSLHRQASHEEIAHARENTVNIAVPRYSQDSDGDFYSICEQMNVAIKNIITQKQCDDYQLAVATAKICHNLLISTAAPDVQTINMLISGFGRWKRPKLVHAVIAAFEGCKIRPNEITCAAVLNHYIQTDRPDRFSNFVAKMRGVRNALMLANSDITINEKGQDRLIRVNEKKVYQKVYPTPMVFNTLMLGVLRFAGFNRAMEVYIEMREDGWGMDVLGLGHFLEDCIRRADWEGGSFVWEEINSIKRRVKPWHMAKAYSQMLSLCSVTGKTVAFNQVLNDLARRGFDRKRILSSVLGTTQVSRARPGTKAPAWTADNVLIAVSGYLGEHDGPKQTKMSTAFKDDDPFEQNDRAYPLEEGVDMDTAEEAAEPTSDRPTIDDRASGPTHTPAKDADEAWALWMQHELGEPKNQIPKKNGAPEKLRTTQGTRASAKSKIEEKGDAFDGFSYDR